MDLSKLRAASAKRMVNGVEVPRQNTTSSGVRAAMKVGGKNYAGESGEVEGDASRPRLDRPARRNGGCVEKKADGGGVQDYLKDRSRSEKNWSRLHGAAAGISGLGAVVDPDPVSKALLGLNSLTQAGAAIGAGIKSKDMKGAAKKFSETGLPELPSREDRKSGGKVGK